MGIRSEYLVPRCYHFFPTFYLVQNKGLFPTTHYHSFLCGVSRLHQFGHICCCCCFRFGAPFPSRAIPDSLRLHLSTAIYSSLSQRTLDLLVAIGLLRCMVKSLAP